MPKSKNFATSRSRSRAKNGQMTGRDTTLKHYKMVCEARRNSDSGGSVHANNRSPSSITTSGDSTVSSTSSASSTKLVRGEGPARHVFTRPSSNLLCFFSFWFSTKHVRHRAGQRDILTSPVVQSTSGLWSRNHENPRTTFCLPNEVTAN